jgi:hypothetical protein
MNTANFRPRAIAASEPVAVATAARAVLYLYLTKRGVDPQTMAMIVTIFEVVLAYLTRRAVTPLHRTVRGPELAVDSEEPSDPPSEVAAPEPAQSALSLR